MATIHPEHEEAAITSLDRFIDLVESGIRPGAGSRATRARALARAVCKYVRELDDVETAGLMGFIRLARAKPALASKLVGDA